MLTSQSNLSRQLADLEGQLGKKLFERGSRKIHLTEEGLFLQRRAQEIVDLEERTAKEIAAFDDMTSGEVHLGGAETNTMHFVADVIRHLREKLEITPSEPRYLKVVWGLGYKMEPNN